MSKAIETFNRDWEALKSKRSELAATRQEIRDGIRERPAAESLQKLEASRAESLEADLRELALLDRYEEIMAELHREARRVEQEAIGTWTEKRLALRDRYAREGLSLHAAGIAANQCAELQPAADAVRQAESRAMKFKIGGRRSEAIRHRRAVLQARHDHAFPADAEAEELPRLTIE